MEDFTAPSNENPQLSSSQNFSPSKNDSIESLDLPGNSLQIQTSPFEATFPASSVAPPFYNNNFPSTISNTSFNRNSNTTDNLEYHSVETFYGDLEAPSNPSLSSSQYLHLLQQQMLLNDVLEMHNRMEVVNNLNQNIDDVTKRSVLESTPPKRTIKEQAGRFVIFQQPDATQRRSYAREKRFLNPKPIVICTRESIENTNSNNPLPKIVEGTVSVELAFYDQTKKVNDLKYLPHLLKSTDKTVKSLIDNTAEFELSVMGNSKEHKFVLVFRIEYKEEGGEVVEEQLVSTPFKVVANANKLKTPKEYHKAPKVKGLNPKEGPCNSESEVWIKGSQFCPQVKVSFAGKPAKILSIEENLLCVLAPSFPELKEDTEVDVTITNVWEGSESTATLRFTYFVGDRASRLQRQAVKNLGSIT